MAYQQPVWRAGVASNAGVRPEDSWKMPQNAMGGPGCSGEWAGGHWDTELVEEEEEEVAKPKMRRPKVKPPRAKRSKPAASVFDGLF